MDQIIIDFANALKRQFCTHCMPAMDFEESTCGYQGACSYHQRIDEVLALYEDEQGGEVVAAADAEPIRHGRLIEDRTEYICSVCGQRFRDEIRFIMPYDDGGTQPDPARCPACGAHWDQEGAEDDTENENVAL